MWVRVGVRQRLTVLWEYLEAHEGQCESVLCLTVLWEYLEAHQGQERHPQQSVGEHVVLKKVAEELEVLDLQSGGGVGLGLGLGIGSGLGLGLGLG